MMSMFVGCRSLKELNISNFDTKNVNNMGSMFGDCSKELKNKIKLQNKNIEVD